MEPSASRAGVAHAVLAAMDVRGVDEKILAEASGIPLSTLRARLEGRSPFRVDELDRIATCLGTTPSSLMAPTKGIE